MARGYLAAQVERLDRAHQRFEWKRTGIPSASLEQMIVDPQTPSQGEVETAQPDIAGLTERAATIVSERFPNVGLHDINSLVQHEVNSRREEIAKIEKKERRIYPYSTRLRRSFPRFEYMPELQRSALPLPQQQDISQPPTFVEGGAEVGPPNNAEKTPRFQNVRKCLYTSKLLLSNIC